MHALLKTLQALDATVKREPLPEAEMMAARHLSHHSKGALLMFVTSFSSSSPGVARTDARVKAWETALAELPKKCPGVVRFEMGWNISNRPIAYDFGLNSGFATRADLDAYGPHPAHQAVVAQLREIADWIICDYEVGEWVSD
jgi:hypothetical protein